MRSETPSDQPFTPDATALEISDETYHKLRELSIEMVQGTILGKAKEMAPVLFVHYRKIEESGVFGDLEHAIVMIACGIADTEAKYKTIFELGKRFYENEMFPAAVFMGTEAWISEQTEVAPSKDPKRRECIVISGVSVGKECRSMNTIPIGHDKDGYIIKEGKEFQLPCGATIESPLLDQFFIGFFSESRKRNEQNERRNRR